MSEFLGRNAQNLFTMEAPALSKHVYIYVPTCIFTVEM